MSHSVGKNDIQSLAGKQMGFKVQFQSRQRKALLACAKLHYTLPSRPNPKPKIKILDITRNKEYEPRLFRCLAPMPFRKYRRRVQYLETAVPKGFHKRIMFLDGDLIGQIEYAPAEASGLPISGDGVVVMNCIWVLRRAKGHNLGRTSLDAAGFATLALENHPSPWMKKDQIEKLGFVSMDSVELRHKAKHKENSFAVHLMWLALKEEAERPGWSVEDLLEGVTFCMAHPLYNPESLGIERIFERR
jgi:hypothetical protein